MGNRVRELRKEQKLSQEQLARESNVSLGTIRVVENGHLPRLVTAKAIARVLGVTVDELFPEEVATA